MLYFAANWGSVGELHYKRPAIQHYIHTAFFASFLHFSYLNFPPVTAFPAIFTPAFNCILDPVFSLIHFTPDRSYRKSLPVASWIFHFSYYPASFCFVYRSLHSCSIFRPFALHCSLLANMIYVMFAYSTISAAAMNLLKTQSFVV